jgi:hypothetical protein
MQNCDAYLTEYLGK